MAEHKRGRPRKGDVPMKQVAIRLPVNLIEELDAKVASMDADPLARAERSVLVRVLLQEAIEARRKSGNW